MFVGFGLIFVFLMGIFFMIFSIWSGSWPWGFGVFFILIITEYESILLLVIVSLFRFHEFNKLIMKE
jgi:hypothetical protein